MTTFVNRGTPQATSNYYYRPAPPAPPRQTPNVRDDYERWYTETIPNNRTSLALRSGIHSEISWALERLCRLGFHEQFFLGAYPGLLDGLFDWPEWYVTKGHKQATDEQFIFSPPRDWSAQHRYALESLSVMRNAIVNDLQAQNVRELASHSHSLPLISKALENLDFTKDQNQEMLLYILEIFQVLAPSVVIDATVRDSANPIIPLNRIVAGSSNRSMIIAAFSCLNILLGNPASVVHLGKASDALATAIRYLPLFVDRPLLEVAVEHVYVHVANPASARAFLLNPQLSNVVKILSSMIIAEQVHIEETVTIDITKASHSVPSTTLISRDYELTKEQFDEILEKPEPQRCYEWMRQMLVPKPEGEMTQVDIWTMYKEAFTPYQDKHPLLGASEVIKNIAYVYPTAQAMVLSGPVQRFVVRGIDRRKNLNANERFKCQWDRNSCTVGIFPSPSELAEHLLEHLSSVGASAANNYPCAWSTCSQTLSSVQHLRSHILTHIPSPQPPQRHSSQSETVTLSADDPYYSSNSPTTRTIPPPPKTIISYQRAALDPPPHCLTALLTLRILFRTAFADVEAAPKVDEDHFGFPGTVEDDADDWEADSLASDMEGAKRGRKAFSHAGKTLENIRVRDETLNGWVAEMVDAVTPDIVVR